MSLRWSWPVVPSCAWFSSQIVKKQKPPDLKAFAEGAVPRGISGLAEILQSANWL
jgi:hypothetical protein